MENTIPHENEQTENYLNINDFESMSRTLEIPNIRSAAYISSTHTYPPGENISTIVIDSRLELPLLSNSINEYLPPMFNSEQFLWLQVGNTFHNLGTVTHSKNDDIYIERNEHISSDQLSHLVGTSQTLNTPIVFTRL